MFSPRIIAATTATAPKAAVAVCVVMATIGGTNQTGPGIEVSV